MLFDRAHPPAPHIAVNNGGPCVTRVHVRASPLLRTGLGQILDGTRFVLADPAPQSSSRLSEDDAQAADLFIVDRTERPHEISYLIAELKMQHPAARVIVLADRFELDDIVSARLAGADGFCLTTASPDVLVRSIELVMLGEIVIPSDLIQAMIEGNAHAMGLPDLPNLGMIATMAPERPFSNREVEVLNLLMEGAPNKVIARKLDVAEATVKVHVKTILRKIGVHNRAQAALWAAYHMAREAAVE